MKLEVTKRKEFQTIDYLMFGDHKVDVYYSQHTPDSMIGEFDIDDSEDNSLLETILDYDITEAVLYDMDHEPFTVDGEQLREYFASITFSAKGMHCFYEV